VVKQQVDEKLIAINFKTKLAADKGKTGSEFQQEPRNVADQRAFDVALMRLVAQPEKVKMVRIFEYGDSKPVCAGMRRLSKLVIAAPWRR